MALRVIQIHNLDVGNDNTYAGQLILDGEYHTIESEYELSRFRKHALLNQHLWAVPALVGISDGVTIFTGDAGSKWLNEEDLVDPDGKKLVHSTPRKHGLTTYITGRGDDPATDYTVGGPGTVMSGHHEVGDATPEVVNIVLNTIENESHMHEGYIQFKDALNDCITLEIVPRLTLNTSADTGTNYDLYGGYLVIPAAPGTGTLAVPDVDRMLVEVPQDENGVRAKAGYFDAVWNTSTKQFDSIAPNYTGEGQFNMFTVGVTLDRFMNQQCMLGSGTVHITTADASMYGHNMCIRLTLETMGADHDWWWNATLVLYRIKTV
jgi:hypothetical protein